MSDRDAMGYQGEEVQLDKIRHIKFTMRGLKIIAKKFGSVVGALKQMENINPDFDEEGMNHIAMLLQAGLVHEEKELTIDDVENMITFDNMTPIFQVIVRSLGGSIPEPKELGGSEGTEGETQALTLTDTSILPE